MTRKDYKLIAEIIKNLPVFVNENTDSTYHYKIVEAFTNGLKGTNPRYQSDRFFRAAKK